MFLSEYVQKWGMRTLYVLFFLGLFFRLFLAQNGFLDQIAAVITYPFLQVHATINDSIVNVQKKIKTLAVVKQELYQSFQEIEALERRVIELEQQAAFYEKTREMVAFSQRYKESFYLLSKVLLRKFSDHEHLLYLDAGSRQGVQKNMIVVYNHCLIGRVIRVYGLYSEVVSILDKRCKIAADIYGKEIEAIYAGTNQGHGLLTFVPHFKTVVVGDRVYSAGKGLLYPQGFLLGSVAEIKSGAVDQEMLIQPAVDFESLHYVYLIKS
jgi:rod shape-determining protein MreC